MAAKKGNGSTINIKGGVKAGRDVVMGDQYNYGLPAERLAAITTPEAFRQALDEIQTQITNLVKQPDLTPVQKRNVEAAEKQVAEAAEEAGKPNADAGRIQGALKEVKETFDLLSGTLVAAAKLGATLAPIIGLAVQVFGG